MTFSYSSIKEFKFISDFGFCFSFAIFSRGCKLVNIVTLRTNTNQDPIHCEILNRAACQFYGMRNFH